MAHRHRRRAAITIATTAGLLASALIPTGTALAAKSSSASRHTVTPAPAWATHTKATGSVPAGQHVHAKVWLAPRDAAGLTAFVADSYNPASANYGKALTPAQYDSRFAASAAQVAAVRSWLTKAGLTVEGAGPDNHFLAVSGTPAAIAAAFGAQLAQFTVDGTTAIASTTAVTAPSDIAANVVAVTGLDTLAHWTHPQSTVDDTNPDAPGSNNGHRVNLGPTGGYVNATPCSDYYGEKVATDLPDFQGEKLPYAVCGYTPNQLRDAYGVTASGLTGKGVTVAITDAFASPTVAKDANEYAARHGDKPFAHGQFTQVNDRGYDPQRVGDCGGNGWYGEETLDVEAVHGIAPDANVMYYGAASCYDDDLMAAMLNVVHDDKASLVSNSWGEPTYVNVDGTDYPVITADLVKAYNGVFLQAAIQHIGFYFSSGDGGDEATNYGVIQSDWPASDPYVTAVGGTALAVGKDGNRLFETGWGTKRYSLNADGTAWKYNRWLYGAGGGCFVNPNGAGDDLLSLFAKPDYQHGVDTNCTNRAVPDIAMVADPTTGMRVGETQKFPAPTVWGKGAKYGEYRIGGTSLASPLTAGLNAVAQQGRSRIGFANPMIYGLYRTNPSVFFDVTSVTDQKGDPGNIRVDNINGLNAAAGLRATVRTFDDDSSLHTGPGWDAVTGVGTPTVDYISAVHSAG